MQIHMYLCKLYKNVSSRLSYLYRNRQLHHFIAVDIGVFLYYLHIAFLKIVPQMMSVEDSSPFEMLYSLHIDYYVLFLYTQTYGSDAELCLYSCSIN